MNPLEINKKTRRVLDLIAFFYIVMFAISSFYKLSNGQFGLFDGISILLGSFIISSLYSAKEWAKGFISISCLIIIAIIIPELILYGKSLNIFGFILLLSIVLGNIYIIRFLFFSDLYKKYEQIIRKEYDFIEGGRTELLQIINSENIFSLNFSSTEKPYLVFTKSLFLDLGLMDVVKNISLENDSLVLLETADVIFEIEAKYNLKSFDEKFLKGLNVALKEIQKDNKYLGLIFPNSTFDKQEKNIVLATEEEFGVLEKQGYC